MKSKFSKKTIFVIGILFVVILITVVLPFLLANQDDLESTDIVQNYYTLDVNPSFILSTNNQNNVLEISARNEEGNFLLNGYQYQDLSVIQVIDDLLQLMIAEGYIIENKDNEILIGYFGEETDDAINMLNSYISKDAEKFCNFTIVSDSYAYKISAEKEGENPAKKKLLETFMIENNTPTQTNMHSYTPIPSTTVSPITKEDATDNLSNEDGTSDDSGTKIKDDDHAPKYDMKKVTVKATASDDGSVKLTWNKIDDKHVGGYYVLHSATNSKLTYPGEGYLTGTSQAGPAEYTILPHTYKGTKPGESAYYSIATVYDDDNTISGNVIRVTMPYSDKVPTSDDDVTLENIQLSGYLSGDKIILNWTKSESKYFKYYFMNCFVDGSEPYYTRGYFAQEMYGINNTSLTVYDGYLGSSGARLRPLKAGETYTFNIWAIYYGSSGDSIKSRTGSFRITLLGESGLGEDPIEPPNLSTFYVENGKFHFAFDKIEHSELDSYNVVYSSVDSTPIAGEPNVSLLYSVVNYSDNSNKWINIENMESGKTYYFSITAYYKNGAKLGGNVRTYIVPLNSTAEPTPAPTTEPTAEPTATPTTEPTAAPTTEPTAAPT